MKLTKGSTIPDFTFETPFTTGRTLYETVGTQPTFLLFLRYYGCTICQLDIHKLAANYQAFTDKGAKVLVVLQSKPELIRGEIKEGDLPFEIICDPEQKLYRELEIGAAKNKLGMIGSHPFATIKKLKEAQTSYKHGEYEGNEMQLPACFLVEEGGKVAYAHYAGGVADLPTHEEMLALL